jgi:hypothetical protein
MLAPGNPQTAAPEWSFLTQGHNRPNKYNAANNLLYTNARIERAMNSENLGARMVENRAWGKMVFLGDSE